MKNRLISMGYLLALLFSVNLMAEEPAKEEPAKEEEKPEGTVEPASNSLNLDEGNVDHLFIDTIGKVLGGLLSKGGMPAHHAKKIADEAAQKVQEEVEKEKDSAPAANRLSLNEASVNPLFIDTIGKVLGGLLSKGGMPEHHAKKIAEEAAQEVHKEVTKEQAAAAANSLSLNETNVDGFDLKSILGTGLKIASTLLSKGHAPEKAHAEAVKAMEEEAAKNTMNLNESSVNAFDFGALLKTGASILGGLLSAGVAPDKAHAAAVHAAAELHKDNAK